MWTRLLRFVAGKIIAKPIRRHLAAFERATKQPAAVQNDLLKRIVNYHRHTDFGRDHHFDAIRNVADFRRNMRVVPYDYFEPYLERVRKGELNALLADSRVLMFALTSGTTATRKTIPVTPQYVRDYKRGWNMWGLKVFRDHPEVKMRPIVQLSGDWQESTTAAGIPCGAVTGLTATMQRRAIRFLYCVPACVGRVKDPIAKYYLALRLSIPRRPGMLLAANPSTLLNLARFGDERKETLLRDIADGTLSQEFDVPPDIRLALRRRLRRPRQRRIRELEEIIRRTDHLYPKDYWPAHCLIGNWTGGSVGSYLRHFPPYFGDVPIRDVGLIASEGRMTIPMHDNSPSGVLDVTTHFFEFIPEAEGDSDNPTVLSAHEVEEGKKYYILLTTSYGLYRYHIHDLVRVTGFCNQTPLVEFLSKGSLFSNLTGEKISEYHVTGAMQQILPELDLQLDTYALAPCWSDRQPYYGLFIERDERVARDQAIRLGDRLDRKLQELNIEYAAKRASRRLGPIRLQLLPAGAWREWDMNRLRATGGALEQYKHPCLISDPEFRATMPIEEELLTV